MKFYLLKSKKDDNYINGSFTYGYETYENDLDYCLIKDLLNREEAMKGAPKVPKRGATPVLTGWVSELILWRKQIEELLDSIYAIQQTRAGSAEYRRKVSELMPYVIKLGRDIESKDFQKEMWYTSEFCERLLKTGADAFFPGSEKSIQKETFKYDDDIEE